MGKDVEEGEMISTGGGLASAKGRCQGNGDVALQKAAFTVNAPTRSMRKLSPRQAPLLTNGLQCRLMIRASNILIFVLPH